MKPGRFARLIIVHDNAKYYITMFVNVDQSAKERDLLLVSWIKDIRRTLNLITILIGWYSLVQRLELLVILITARLFNKRRMAWSPVKYSLF